MSTGAIGGPGILVVGASQSGAQLVASLREMGHDGPVTLAGAERHAPYQRPPLSKKALREGLTPDLVQLRNERFYEDRGVVLKLGCRVDRVERGPDGSGVAWTRDGEALPFRRLALTVGARARHLRLPGHDLDNVVVLRSVDDATALRTRMQAAQQVVVIGGGFIGLEVAASARLLGKDVTVVLADDQLMARSVGALVGRHFLTAHRRSGTRVHLAARPRAFVDDGAGAVAAVELEDGRELEADLVVVGVGASPRTELAEQMGLVVNDGIEVDDRCLASDRWTVAAGDCASILSPMSGQGPERLRFESVSTAVEQAKVAASTLLGGTATYRAVPWFWSDQGADKLQVAGLTHGSDRLVVRGSVDEGSFAVLHYQGERLIAAECVNRPGDFVAIRRALNAGDTIDMAGATDTTVSMKALRRRFDTTLAGMTA
ncbi:NAD(P)/FAD-dependent oxidoreductase [Pseudonocardia sp. CA-107938]|uniref:NAD(P)/FAD-dependent oxidoreductase n=1 Tax=Pseudonocardia sp. CA-107938 TaxID=3240021 RepID=UPI003D933751